MNRDPVGLFEQRLIEDHYMSSRTRDLIRQHFQTSSVTAEMLKFIPDKKVGIIGAGIGGLYIAMLLSSIDIDYEILEASGRTGGRLFTYAFTGNDAGENDYYDAGAMRFPLPKIEEGVYGDGFMKRLAKLTQLLGMERQEVDTDDGEILPYYHETRFSYYNGTHEPPFAASGMGIDEEYIEAGASAISADFKKPFVSALEQDARSSTSRKWGWEAVRNFDSLSVRGYLATKYIPGAHLGIPPRHLPTNVINWMGLTDGSSSGGYDRSFTEAILSSIAFSKESVDWKCFKGGSQTLTNKMEKWLDDRNKKVDFGERVTTIKESSNALVVQLPHSFSGITPADASPAPATVTPDLIINDNAGQSGVKVQLPCLTVTTKKWDENGAAISKTHKFLHVFSTLPLPALHNINLEHAKLNTLQKNALRQSDYGPAVKIAIRFSRAWWADLGIHGGQANTDLPIRTIVYPSYGTEDKPCNVLIASYSWTTDAERIASLNHSRAYLKDLVLANLAEAHQHKDSTITYDYLLGLFRDMHVQDWSRDEFAMGAFPYFCPGDFEEGFTSLVYPAASKRLHFSSEAVSIRHAWVAGALNSAWRAVHTYLTVTEQHEKKASFENQWGHNADWREHLAENAGHENNDAVVDEDSEPMDTAGAGTSEPDDGPVSELVRFVDGVLGDFIKFGDEVFG